MLNITVNHIPFTTPYNRRPKRMQVPKKITVHSTGNPTSSAKGERSWLTDNPSNKRTASWHYVVDEKTIIEAIPVNYVAWHAGDGNGPGNTASIGVEMCESGDREKVLQNTKELIAHLMKTHGISEVVRHYDWTKKNCPRILNADGKWTAWKEFHAEVIDLASYKAVESPQTQVKAEVISKSYLSEGDRSEAVEALQKQLIKAGHKITADGVFGPATEKAVRSFQDKYKLGTDGKAGPKTMAKLKEVTTPKPAEVKPTGEGVISSDVWTHSKADFNAATRVKVLKKGEKVKIFGEVNGLYKIGVNLYVSKKYVIPVVKPVAKTGTATGDVFTHNKPDLTTASRDVVLKRGQTVGVYGEVNGLYKIRLASKTLYVSKKYLSVK